LPWLGTVSLRQCRYFRGVMSRLLSLLSALFLPLALCAQLDLVLTGESDARTIRVRGTMEEGDPASPVFQATWRFAGAGVDPVMEFQRTSRPDAGVELPLDKLLLAGIATYLDAHVHFEKQGVKADLPVPVMVQQLNGMVSAATEELGQGEGAARVSDPTLKQLERLCKIDWSQARFGVDGGQDQDKYLAIFYYVRSQRDELERQLRADLQPLAAVKVLQGEALPPGRSLAINSTCGTVYDDQNYLCALNLTVSDTGMGAPDGRLNDEMLLAIASSAKAEEGATPLATTKIRKRDRWLKEELDRINDRIDRIDQRKELWAVRDRLEDIEGRMDDLGMEVKELRDAGATPHDNPIANLSLLTGRNVTVQFEKGATTISTAHQVLLNEVFEQLARSPRSRVLITGYTDRTGNADANLMLSEQRARSVRDYLLRRGVAEERLLVNYYGDTRSSGQDPGERRVEVEWVLD